MPAPSTWAYPGFCVYPDEVSSCRINNGLFATSEFVARVNRGASMFHNSVGEWVQKKRERHALAPLGEGTQATTNQYVSWRPRSNFLLKATSLPMRQRWRWGSLPGHEHRLPEEPHEEDEEAGG